MKCEFCRKYKATNMVYLKEDDIVSYNVCEKCLKSIEEVLDQYGINDIAIEGKVKHERNITPFVAKEFVSKIGKAIVDIVSKLKYDFPASKVAKLDVVSIRLFFDNGLIPHDLFTKFCFLSEFGVFLPQDIYEELSMDVNQEIGKAVFRAGNPVENPQLPKFIKCCKKLAKMIVDFDVSHRHCATAFKDINEYDKLIELAHHIADGKLQYLAEFIYTFLKIRYQLWI